MQVITGRIKLVRGRTDCRKAFRTFWKVKCAGLVDVVA